MSGGGPNAALPQARLPSYGPTDWPLPDVAVPPDVARSGPALRMRVMGRCDVADVRRFFEALSMRSRAQRFFVPIRTVGEATLMRMASADPRRAVTVLALSGEQIVGVAEYVADPWPECAEFAIAIADAWQGRRIGPRLLQALLGLAAAHGFSALEGDVLADNRAMLSLLRGSGTAVRFGGDDPRVRRARLAVGGSVSRLSADLTDPSAGPAGAVVQSGNAESDATQPTMPPWATIISMAAALNCGK